MLWNQGKMSGAILSKHFNTIAFIEIFDTQLDDPYRWLEDPYSNETKQFVSAQNDLSDSYLKNCDVWRKINEKLTETYNYKRRTLRDYVGDHYYFQMNTGLQNQE